jgi:hypothetical protein
MSASALLAGRGGNAGQLWCDMNARWWIGLLLLWLRACLPLGAQESIRLNQVGSQLSFSYEPPEDKPSLFSP